MTILVSWMERYSRHDMRCKKCKGTVLLDRPLCADNHIELYCLCCGKRWSLRHPQNYGSFGAWIQKVEKKFQHYSNLG